MSDQLPVEILQPVLSSLDDVELLKTAGVCHSFHANSLHVLFTRHSTIKQSPTIPWLVPGSPIKQLHSAPGLCIRLVGKENLIVLYGLRIALARAFEGRPLTVLFCSFNRDGWGEAKSLHRFLTGSPIATTIQTIIFDLERAMHYDNWNCHFTSTLPPNKHFIRELHCLVEGVTNACSGQGRSHLASLSLINGHIFDEDHAGMGRLTSLKRRSKIPNIMKAFAATGSKLLGTLFQPRHSTSLDLQGLHALDIYTSVVFHSKFVDWTFNVLAGRTNTLRVLSFHPGLEDRNWPVVLSCITLPHLEEVYFSSLYPPSVNDLTNFLAHHPSIRILDLGSGNIAEPSRWWRRPRRFLPNLTTLKGSPNILEYFLHSRFGSSRPSPHLKFVTIILLSDVGPMLRPYEHNSLVDSYSKGLEAISLTLQIRIPFSKMDWLEKDTGLAQPYEHITTIEIVVLSIQGFLEMKELQSKLPDWLAQFRMLSNIEIVGCSPLGRENEGSRKTLFEAIKDRNPNIGSLCVDGFRHI